MRQIGLALGVCSLIALGGVGVAGADGGGSKDSVTGSLKRTSLDGTRPQHHIISAHVGRNGAHGTYSATYGKGADRTEIGGRVTCLRVKDNKAMVGIKITKSNDNEARVGMYHLIRIADHGNPNDGGNDDALSPGALSDDPLACPAPVNEFSPYVSGNLVVRDR